MKDLKRKIDLYITFFGEGQKFMAVMKKEKPLTMLGALLGVSKIQTSNKTYHNTIQITYHCLHFYNVGGTGGGIVPKRLLNSGTLPAGSQFTIPCFQTSVSLVRVPKLII